jgi:hypothetical protein
VLKPATFVVNQQKPFVMHTPTRTLTALLCIASTAAVAQPTLSATGFMPLAGEVYSYSHAVYQPVAPNTGGGNAIWDFSTLQPTNFEQISFMSPSSGLYGTSFPTAAVMRKSAQEQYFTMPAGSMERIGVVHDGGVVASCTNSERIMLFPFNYEQSFVDTFRCTFISGVWGSRTGIDSVWADGWGTLILPGDTYTDVLRVRVKSRYTDSITGQSPVVYIDDQTYFYKPGIHASLLAARDAAAFVNGNQIDTKQELRYTNVPTGLTNLAGVKEAIRISPVPANNTLNVDVEHAHERPIRIELWNSIGQVVRQGALEAGSLHASLDCTTLARGTYFLRCADGASSVAKQVALQ